jgi:hypothetical protein
LIRHQETFFANELALSAINGMIGVVSSQLRSQSGLTPDLKREVENKLNLLYSEYHLFYSGDKAIMRKALDEYAPCLNVIFSRPLTPVML